MKNILKDDLNLSILLKKGQKVIHDLVQTPDSSKL